jgi:hypothetical protein
MRNMAFSTCTTNSRGVKSSLSRMTFHSGGRCVSGLVLLRGLTKVGLIMAVLAPGSGRGTTMIQRIIGSGKRVA